MELNKETEGKCKPNGTEWRRKVTERDGDETEQKSNGENIEGIRNIKRMETEKAESKRSEPNPKTTQNGTVTE